MGIGVHEMEVCQKEIQRRLMRYDVVNLLDQDKREMKKTIKESEKECSGGIINHSGKAIDLLKMIISGGRNEDFDFFDALTGGGSIPEYRDENIPKPICDIYMQTMDNLKLFCKGPWWLYEKDVLRAAAYHEYIRDFKLEEDVIECYRSFYEQSEYQNIPIDCKIQTEKDIFNYFPDIGGGILSKDYLCGVNKNFKNVFKKSETEFDSEGMFADIKKKGVNYEILEKGIIDITKKSMSAADIWFFKNVLDPELIVAFHQAIADTVTSIRQQHDYKLIWILCRCRCPSVRLYVFEAIKPCFLYIRNHIKPSGDYMDFFLEKLTYLIRDINLIFQNMVNLSVVCFEVYSTNSEIEISNNPNIKEAFQKGDDFNFVLGNGESVRQCTSAQSRKYYEYVSVKKDLSLNKIAYGIITALHEQGMVSLDEEAQKMEAYKKSLEFQEKYESRLVGHIKGW